MYSDVFAMYSEIQEEYALELVSTKIMMADDKSKVVDKQKFLDCRKFQLNAE